MNSLCCGVISNNQCDRATGLLIIEVTNSNQNGNPDQESDPRLRPDERGMISPVSFKRKLRDLVEDKEGPVWKDTVGGLNLKADDYGILESRGRKRVLLYHPARYFLVSLVIPPAVGILSALIFLVASAFWIQLSATSISFLYCSGVSTRSAR